MAKTKTTVSQSESAIAGQKSITTTLSGSRPFLTTIAPGKQIGQRISGERIRRSLAKRSDRSANFFALFVSFSGTAPDRVDRRHHRIGLSLRQLVPGLR